ncbi:uncharacterized protein LOC119673270 [Teleopsis dalmanni]|uniref:uncharacterized protein LOC119673270 n=1 Tax=Teleopsis dalmanni TaxID=139649 RepID=UPI0018CDEC5A|nr:uncharacterized protein LOC119673270 [Teleopsis dalmanni]
MDLKEIILNEFKLGEDALNRIIAFGLEADDLQFLTEDDIRELFPLNMLRSRVRFRAKINDWKEKLSSDTSFDAENLTESSQNSQPSLKSLLQIMQESSNGRRILQYYEENSNLSNKEREGIIEIILDEYCIYQKRKLKPEDMKTLADEIIQLFSCEKKNYDYYYIPRQRKKSPSGKLFSKYFNIRTKLRKLSESHKAAFENDESMEMDQVVVKTEAVEYMDISVNLSLKNDLSKDTISWDEVLDKWRQTFTLRQSDLTTFTYVEFLSQWPKLKDKRAPELINIDFGFLFPKKQNLLKTKWSDFKNRVRLYYETNIRNSKSRDLFVLSKITKKLNCEDYILTLLLNSVLLPTAVFKNGEGNKSKKVSIEDANEGLVMELPSINDCHKKIEELNSKYYETNSGIQPYLIVEGNPSEGLKSFYIYLSGTIYKFNSFLDSLDICFKLYHVLNLKYPKVCEIPWTLIQKYLFEIDTVNDLKNANLSVMLTYLQSEN